MDEKQFHKNKVNILELFNEEKSKNSFLNVAAPMVRYSKLEFRHLLRKYKTKLCFTPMIIADSFNRSENARNNEFTTNQYDSPLIAQFAAKDSIEFLTASELIYPYVDGVDLNCGCPQNWAINKGYGCSLLKKPELLNDIIKTVQRNLSNNFSISIKMRLLEKSNLKTTINLCRQLESCGITFLTIHGRTPWQKISDCVDIMALSDIKKSIKIPLIFNGDIKHLDDANNIYLKTNCDGIMIARGLLTNPTLFTNTKLTTQQCLQDWLNLSTISDNNITFQCFHHHYTFMMEKLNKKSIRSIFNNLTNKLDVYQFMNDYHNIKNYNKFDLIKLNDNYHNNIICKYDNNLYKKYYNIIDKNEVKFQFDDSSTWSESNNGNFILNF